MPGTSPFYLPDLDTLHLPKMSSASMSLTLYTKAGHVPPWRNRVKVCVPGEIPKVTVILRPCNSLGPSDSGSLLFYPWSYVAPRAPEAHPADPCVVQHLCLHLRSLEHKPSPKSPTRLRTAWPPLNLAYVSPPILHTF